MPPYMAARAMMDCMMSIVYNLTRADPKHNNAAVCIILPGQLAARIHTPVCVIRFAKQRGRIVRPQSMYSA